MAKEYARLDLRLTKKERAILDNLAAKAGVSPSNYIKNTLGLNEIEELSELTIADVPSEFELRTNSYSVGFTDTENTQLEAEAALNHISVSSLIRKKALSAKKIVKIDVYDDDIVDLEHRIQPKINGIYGVVKALQVQSKIHDVQIEKFEKLLAEINDAFRYVTNRVRTNRNRLKEHRVRELAERVNIAIETETSSPAIFDDDEEE